MNLQKETPDLFRKISQLILLSPWVDLSMEILRKSPYQIQQNVDTLAAGADLPGLMGKWYLPEDCRGNEPEFCPVFRAIEEMKNLPPVTVIVGACEVLLGDGVFLADALRRADVSIQLIALEGQTHNYPVFQELTRDGVYVPKLIARIITGRSIEDMTGEDGLGLSLRKFNGLEKR